MLTIKSTKKFQRDLRRMVKQGVDVTILDEIVEKLAREEKLDAKHRDHALKGEWLGYRECHITPDWLLVYKIKDNELILSLSRTGSHSYIFG